MVLVAVHATYLVQCLGIAGVRHLAVVGDAILIALHRRGGGKGGLIAAGRAHTYRRKRRPRAVEHEHDDQEQSQ